MYNFGFGERNLRSLVLTSLHTVFSSCKEK